MKKWTWILCLILTLCLIPVMAVPGMMETAGTSDNAADENAEAAANAAAAVSADVDLSQYFTDRDLSGTWKENQAVTLALSDSVTITQEGTYILTGAIQDGTVTVNVTKEEKVQLVLSGVSIASSSSAAILVESADKVFITLAEGTENTLTCTGFDETGDVDAAIFSRDDLVLNGSGSLTIQSANHGIVGKDDLKITGGTYVINAKGRGIDANDSVRIAGGDFTIVSDKDAIRAKHDEADKGYVLIAGGVFDLTVGGGAESAASTTVYSNNWGGRQQMGGSNGGTAAAVSSDSAKGLKASGTLTVLGGQFAIDAADDALHSDSDILLAGGVFTIATGDDGMHADNALTITGGAVSITKSYEGLEASNITVAGGSISIYASDDGMNASGGNDGSGMGGLGWNDMFSSDGSSITISGGTLYVNASGDGIDSNGDLTVTGGAIVVSGPTNSGNGALDKNGTATITGGTILAAGAAGMAETFDSGSTQCSVLVNLRANPGEITVTDSKGSVILSGAVEKAFQTVVISSPDLVAGETYTVSCGGVSATFTASSGTGGSGGGQGGSGGGQQGGSGGGQQGGWQGGGR